MAALKRPAAYVGEAPAPDSEHVEARNEVPLGAPEDEERDVDRPTEVGFVVDEVDRRSGPIVLARGVKRGGVAEAALVLRNRFRVEVRAGAPAAEHPVEEVLRLGADHPLRQAVRLDEEEPV